MNERCSVNEFLKNLQETLLLITYPDDLHQTPHKGPEGPGGFSRAPSGSPQHREIKNISLYISDNKLYV